MAKRNSPKAAATPSTVTIDAIDELVTKLNTIDGLAFVRDAWVNKAPDNYGVVETQGEISQLWADGKLIDSIWRVIIHVYIAGDDDSIAYTVQDKLEDLESDGKVDLTHTINRDFDAQVGKVHWQWIVNLYGSLTREEPAPASAESGNSGED